MERNESRVEERGGEDDLNILKFSSFHLPSTFLSLLPLFVPNIP
jgi:hypothetical protein